VPDWLLIVHPYTFTSSTAPARTTLSMIVGLATQTGLIWMFHWCTGPCWQASNNVKHLTESLERQKQETYYLYTSYTQVATQLEDTRGAGASTRPLLSSI